MMAPASVPHEMMHDSWNQMRWYHCTPRRARLDERYGDRRRCRITETIEVSHTSKVSGALEVHLVDVGVLGLGAHLVG